MVRESPFTSRTRNAAILRWCWRTPHMSSETTWGNLFNARPQLSSRVFMGNGLDAKDTRFRHAALARAARGRNRHGKLSEFDQLAAHAARSV